MMLQVEYINAYIRAAGRDSPQYKLPLVEDPCDKLIEVHLAALKWNMQQRRFGLTAEGCERLHQLSVELLELLKSNMPDKTGQSSGWKIEKAHSILHKVWYIPWYIYKYIAWYITCDVPGQGDYPVWMVRKFQHPRPRTLPY